MNELPREPSKLIRLAVGDLKKCEEDSRYEIDMSGWHVPDFVEDVKEYNDSEVEVCNVCFAGAIMAKTLDCDVSFNGQLDSFKDKDKIRFIFLDYIRQYKFYWDDLSDLYPLDISTEEEERIYEMYKKVKPFVLSIKEKGGSSYEDDPETFKKNMLLIADKFEEVGL